MAAEDKSRPAVPISSESWLTQKYRGADLRPLMSLVASEKRTGQLTIHFNQGGFSFCEWKARKEA
jgi:hypothetical protein